MTTHLENPPTTETDPERPHALNERWRDAFNAGDLDALMATYEPDALIVPGPGAPPLQGHDAIAAALTWFLSLGGILRFTPRHWLVTGDLAYSSIDFVLDGGTDDTGAPVDLRGTTAEVLRRQDDGRWKYAIDHPFGGSAESS